MPFLDVSGGRLYYEAAGQGQAVVFVHAGIADNRMWQPQWEAFSPRFRVVRYDTRTYGRTTTEDVPYSNRADLLAVLDHLGIERAVLIGCSRGGQIAADFTLEHPQRVSALVLVCAGVGGVTSIESDPDQDALFMDAEAAEEAGDWAKVIELDVRAWVDGFGRPMDAATDARLEPIRALVREMEWASVAHHDEGGQPIVLDPPAAGRLAELRLPVLLIAGDYDEMATQKLGELYASGVAGARLVRLPTAHLPNLEMPDEFNRLVLDFLT
ncbi:MAG: alpha/beta fold hydrolase [Anaerolineae bacterium]|nr:alpha/beta fold hydrolase [Anaerolineae bacterium]